MVKESVENRDRRDGAQSYLDRLAHSKNRDDVTFTAKEGNSVKQKTESE